MDIYGKLNNETVKKEYVGSTTDTAKVKVDNQSNVVSAEVYKVPNKLIIDYWDKENGYVDVEYDGSGEVKVHIPQISDVNQLLSRMDDAEQDIDSLESNLNTLNNQINDPQNEHSIINQLNRVNEIVAQNTEDIVELKEKDISLTEDIQEINSKIVPASKQQMGMIWRWVSDDGTIYISAEDPNEVNYTLETLPNGSQECTISTYNYNSEILDNGSLSYEINIGE